jgi:hypothetical protein
MTSQSRTQSRCGRGARCSSVLLLLWLGSQGCGDDTPTKIAKHRDSGTESDAGPDATSGDLTDAGPDATSGNPDAAQSGDTDASQSGLDGSTQPDHDGSTSNPTDSGTVSMEPVPCADVTSENDSFMSTVKFTDEGPFALSTGTTGFGVAYAGLTCGELDVMPVSGSTPFGTPRNVLEDCSTIRDMTLLHVTDGWRMVWIDNSADTGAELQSMLLSENMSGSVGAARTQLTSNMVRERRPALANVAGKPLLAYIATDALAGTASISTRLLEEPATVHEVVSADAGRVPLSLALLKIGKLDVALAWVEEQGKPGVWLQRASLEGEANGEPVLLTDLVSAGSTVDLAARDEGEGGAVLYSTDVGGESQEVRFRRLSDTGELLGDEIKVVSQPLQARDASFARVGGGYVVAYRALPGGGITAPEIRMTVITKDGKTTRDAQGDLVSYKLADAGEGGGRLTVRLSNDGQLLVGFADASASTKQFRLVRKRLDCAQ